jgi:hypothetical protein
LPKDGQHTEKAEGTIHSISIDLVVLCVVATTTGAIGRQKRRLASLAYFPLSIFDIRHTSAEFMHGGTRLTLSPLRISNQPDISNLIFLF